LWHEPHEGKLNVSSTPQQDAQAVPKPQPGSALPSLPHRQCVELWDDLGKYLHLRDYTAAWVICQTLEQKLENLSGMLPYGVEVFGRKRFSFGWVFHLPARWARDLMSAIVLATVFIVLVWGANWVRDKWWGWYVREQCISYGFTDACNWMNGCGSQGFDLCLLRFSKGDEMTYPLVAIKHDPGAAARFKHDRQEEIDKSKAKSGG
jgi:hypothetical protein